MNQEPSYAKLLDTVREAGGDVQTMTAFAALVAAAEREACAKICDKQAMGAYWEGADVCAHIIRARGETK